MTKQNKQYVKNVQKEHKETKQKRLYQQTVRAVRQEHLMLLKEYQHARNVLKIQFQKFKEH